mgnify:CR=1 FL=1
MGMVQAGKRMTYPSKTPTARRAESKARRDKQKELLRQVNERLAAIGIDWKQLMKLVADGEVTITVKEK